MILFVDSEDPNQTGQMHRLIWAFPVRESPKTCFSHGVAHIIWAKQWGIMQILKI